VGLHVILSDIILAEITLAWLLNAALLTLEVAVGLGMVIFVHELGHFAVAKWCGVKCEKFYIGFDIGGKNLGKFKWGETEYGIGIIPLGGYVKMLGQEDNPARVQEEIERAKLAAAETGATPANAAGVTGEPPAYDPRSYLAQPVWKRMAIISAGVIMNVIFAFVIASIAFGMGVKYVPAVISNIVPGGPAWQAGLRVGDDVIQIGEIRNPTFSDLQETVTLGNHEKGVPVWVRRPHVDETLKFTVSPALQGKNALAPTIGVEGGFSNRLASERPVAKHLPAGRTTPPFEGGDEIVAIDVGGARFPIKTYGDLHRVLAVHAADTLSVTVRRKHGEEAAIVVTPNHQKDLGVVMEMGLITGVQAGSPAARAGLRPEDRLLEINGQPVDDPMTLPDMLRRMAGETVSLRVQRGRETFAVDVTVDRPESFEQPFDEGQPVTAPALGIAYRVLNRIRTVKPGSPADTAGVKPGDVIAKAELIPAEKDSKDEEAQYPSATEFGDDEPNWPFFYAGLLQFSLPDTKVRLTLRGNRTVELTPAVSEDSFNPQRGLRVDRIERTRRANDLAEAVRFGSRETTDKLSMVFRVIQKIGSGRVSPKALGGPGTIAAVAGSAASQGMPELLLFLTMLSANLAVVNFLPIPLLDGGHMVFLGYEAVFRRPANERVALVLHYAGFLFIISLMAFVIFLDAQRGFDWVMN